MKMYNELITKRVRYKKKNGEIKTYEYNNYYQHKTDRRKSYLTSAEENDIVYANIHKNITKINIGIFFNISRQRVARIVNNFLKYNPDSYQEYSEPYMYDTPEITRDIVKRIHINRFDNKVPIKKLQYLYHLSRYMVRKICSWYDPY